MPRHEALFTRFGLPGQRPLCVGLLGRQKAHGLASGRQEMSADGISFPLQRVLERP
jgi:hypothetical protein